MADANVDSVQQSQDAQNLDNLTSLQQADSTTTPQPTGGTADATVTTTNPLAPDTPSLYNEVTGTQNNQPNLEAAGTNSLLDTATFTNDGRDGAANESSTVGSGVTFGTEVNTGDSQVQYTVTNESPTIQGPGTNSTQNTLGGTQGAVAAATEVTPTADAAPAPADTTITNTTPEPTLNAIGTSPADPTVDPLVTDRTPQEPLDVIRIPNLTIIKAASVTSIATEATDIVYTITVENTGDVKLTNVSWADEMAEGYIVEVATTGLGTVASPYGGWTPVTTAGADSTIVNDTDGTITVGTLAVGETKVYRFTYDVSQSEFDAARAETADFNGDDDKADIDNTVTASADTEVAGESVGGTLTASAEVEVLRTPQLEITKVANVGSIATEATDIVYTITVENTGDVKLTNVSWADEMAEGYIVEVATTGLGTVASPYGGWTPVTTAGADSTIVNDTDGTITVGTLAVGETKVYRFTYDVSQSEFDAARAETADFNGDDDKADIDNTVTASADTEVAGESVGGTLTASAEVEVLRTPQLEITKVANVGSIATEATDIVYTITVENTGDVKLTNVSWADEMAEGYIVEVATTGLGTVASPYGGWTPVTTAGADSTIVNDTDGTITVGTLAVGETKVYRFTYDVSQSEFDAARAETADFNGDDDKADIDNTVTASADTEVAGESVGGTLTASAEVEVLRTPQLEITKVANVGSIATEATDIVYTITVENTGDVKLTNVSWADEMAEGYIVEVATTGLGTVASPYGGWTPVTTAGADSTIVNDTDGTITVGTLAVGETKVYRFTYDVSQSEFDAARAETADFNGDDDKADIDNTVTASADTEVAGESVGGTLTASAEVEVLRTPQLEITKVANVGSIATEATDIVYTITVENTGDVKLTNVSWADEMAEGYIVEVATTGLGTVASPYGGWTPVTTAGADSTIVNDTDGTITVGTLAVGETKVYRFTYDVSQSEFDAARAETADFNGDDDKADIDNTVTASADTEVAGESVGGTLTASAEVEVLRTPQLEITKVANVGSIATEATDIVYTITVENTGDVKLTNVSWADEMAEGYIVEVATTGLGTVASPYGGWTPVTTAGADSTIVNDTDGTITVGTLAVGETKVYRFTYDVSQSEFDAARAETADFNGDDDKADIDNTVTASADTEVAGESVGGTLTASAEVEVLRTPQLEITKVANVGSIATEATDIVYTITVENTGDVKLTNVSWADEMAEGYIVEVATTGLGTVASPYGGWTPVTTAGADSTIVNDTDGTITVGTLAVGETKVYRFTYDVSQSEFDAARAETADFNGDDDKADIDNTVTASADTEVAGESVGGTLTASAEVEVLRTPQLEITKVANVGSIATEATDIVYTITVENTGDVKLTNVSWADEMAEGYIVEVATTGLGTVASPYGGWTPVTTAGADSTIVNDTDGTITVGTLAVGETKVYRFTYDVSQSEFDAARAETADFNGDDDKADIDNTVTASADTEVAGESVGGTLTASAEVEVLRTPQLEITKVANVGSIATEATDIVYTITVENTGDVKLTNVSWADEMAEGYIVEVATTGLGTVASPYGGWTPVTTAGADSTIVNDTDGTITVGTLAVGETKVYRFTYDVSQSEFDAARAETADFNGDDDKADIDNTVTASADTEVAGESVGGTLTASAEVEVLRTPQLEITKVANVGSIATEATDIVYTITVENTGDVKLTNVSWADEMAEGYIVEVATTGLGTVASPYGGWTPVTTAGADSTIVNDTDGTITVGTLAVGETKVYRFTYDVSQSEFDAARAETADFNGDDDKADIDNTVTASADTEVAGESVGGTLTASAEVEVLRTPQLEITKVANVGSIATEATDIVYTITVENTGDVKLTNVSWADEMAEGYIVEVATTGLGTVASPYGGWTPVTTAGADSTIVNDTDGTITVGTLAVGETKVYRFTYDVSQSEFDAARAETADFNGDDDKADIDNTVTASADTEVAGESVGGTLTASAEVQVLKTQELSIWKTGVVHNADGNLDRDFAIESESDYVRYAVVVQNTGTQTLSSLTVTDNKILGSLDASTSDLADLYAPGHTIAFKVGSYVDNTFKQNTEGTLTATGTIGAGGLITLTGVTLAPGQALQLSYDYDVTAQDLFEKIIENVVIADSYQTNPVDPDYENSQIASDGVATYEVSVLQADVAIRKFADVKSVTEGDLITYKLLVTNEGTSALTQVRVKDAMFASAADMDMIVLAGKQISATLYTVDSNGRIIDSNPTSYTVDLHGDLVIGDLAVNQYVEISYSHTVTVDDYDIITTGVTESIFDYTGTSKGPIGDLGALNSTIDFSYGSFSAYVNKTTDDPYALEGDPARIFVNVDNTGVAVGVNAGVMSGDRNYNSDHLKATFDPSFFNGGKSLVESVGLVFTNAKDVEVAFTVSYGKDGDVFTGSIVVDGRGVLTLREVDRSDNSLHGFSDKPALSSTYKFIDAVDGPIGANWFTVTEANGPGGAQNKLYTINFAPGNEFINTFDFWVVGDDSDNSLDQIKVVDIQFNTLDFRITDVVNTATVYSYEDGLSDQSDEIASSHVSVLTDLDQNAANILGSLDSKLLSDPDLLRVDHEATGTLTFTGTAQEGGTLTASFVGAFDPDGSFTTAYQWQEKVGAEWRSLAGEVGSTLAIPGDQSYVGKEVRLTATTTDGFGGKTTFETLSQTITNLEDEASGTLTFTGTAQEGGTLTASFVGAFDPDGSFTTAYQWQEKVGAEWRSLAGEVGSTLAIPGDQSYVGKEVRLTATTTDGFGGKTTFETLSQTITNLEDEASGTLTFTGTAQEGGTLTASFVGAFDPDGSFTTAYQWQEKVGAEWRSLAGEVGSTLAIPGDQSYVGKEVRLTATTTDGFGGTTAFATDPQTITHEEHEATGTLTFTGTAQEGGTLTASFVGAFDPDGSFTTAYQWQEKVGAEWRSLAGEVGSTLAIPGDQSYVGKEVRLTATTTDGFGGKTTFETLSQTITNLEDEASGTLTFTGTAQEGGTLTASFVGAFDPDGSFTTAYQWQEKVGAEWRSLAGEVGSTLAIPGDQSYVGKEVRLTATTTDGFGGTTAFATDPQTIQNVDDEASGNLVVWRGGSGSKILNIITSGISDPDGAITSLVVTWQVNTGTSSAPIWKDAWSGLSLDTNSINVPGTTSKIWSSNNEIRIQVVTTDNIAPTAGHSLLTATSVFKPQDSSLASADSGVTGGKPLATTFQVGYAPVALDLNNDGISYLIREAGVTHDYNNDGIVESTAWVAPEDGLLAIQKGDGTHNIVFSTQAGETDLQGLAKVYDSNKDGVLDAADTDFAKFGVWQDADSDGVVDSGEYLTLADRGITSLSLTSDGQVHFEANGDVIVYGQTTYTTADGELHIAEDVGFAVSDVYEPLDIAAIIANADAIESVTRIDQLAETDSSSSLMVELGGQTYEIATLMGQEVGTQDILSQFVGNDTSANLLTNKSWTDVIDISSDHGGPGSIIAAGGTLNEGTYANGEGDWTVVINSGDAKVDATNNQITFSSDSAENSVTITTADGSSHNIDNVDKIQWHG